MNDRWIMNRMGFVNFWLYDEETFSFADGKIFLRGANASGKSITTQSFIPFILDGNRNPARLDPFGSKDRKMEYYFLGDGEKEDSTGYIFLEFKKRGSEQYRTIGIGQRARKGQDMLFWGFVVLDGRRVGVDFNLYRKLGMNKLPLSMQELENILNNNEGNFIVKKPGEYKDLVNKYIFKFPRIEQYDQLIKILIKVRAPKLSKDFRPIETYAVLNDSLQTLSDDDMQAMVESMEKMEDIRAKLEDKERALKDVKIISKEYARYYSFMLTRKAQVYLDAKRAADTLREKVRQCSAAIAEHQQAYAALNKANKNLQDLLEA